MLQFTADDFCRASGLIGQLYAQVSSGITPTSGSWGIIAGELGNLERTCMKLGLHTTLAQIDRIKNIFVDGAPSINLLQLGRDVLEVHIRMTDELSARMLFLMSTEEARYFSDSQFAPIVAQKFPDAAFDMDEAGKCYATERATACVFHLMRVTEYGLRSIGSLLQIVDPRPNWDPIIKKIDAELKAPYEKRQFKGSYELLANISTHMQAVNIAWRRNAMHIQAKHTMEEVREIHGATRGLMRYLAENLPS